MTPLRGEGKLELRHLRTFCKVAELGNFTKAAQVLHYTEAAVSQQIQALEKDLGVALFERTTRSVTLTLAGQRFYGFARKILELHQQALDSVRQVQAELTGEVRLAVSTIPGEHLLPPLLSDFRQRHPKVHLITIVSDSEGALSELIKNRADMGVVGLKPHSPKLKAQVWWKDELVSVVPPKHRFALRPSVDIDELIKEPFVLREQGSGTRRALERALEKIGLSVSDLKIVLELGSTEAVKSAVMSGAGVTVLSRWAVEKDLKGRLLKFVPIKGLTIERHFYLVTNNRRALSPAAQALFDFLQQSSPSRQ